MNVIDPVGAGQVASLSRPGGNATGFTLFEYSTAGKLLELLKEISPRIVRIAVLRNPTNPAAPGQLGAIQAVAAAFGVTLNPIDARDAAEAERVLAEFARSPNGGLTIAEGPHSQEGVSFVLRHRDQRRYDRP